MRGEVVEWQGSHNDARQVLSDVTVWIYAAKKIRHKPLIIDACFFLCVFAKHMIDA